MSVPSSARIIAVCLVATLFCCSLSTAQEKKIGKKDVPSPVLSSFAKSYPQAKVRGYAREIENGKTYYEVESMNGKWTLDVLYLADGTLAEEEAGLAPGELPAPVMDAVKTKYPKGKIQRAERTTRGEEKSYELTVTSAKSRVTLVIDANGKILKESKAGGKDEETEEK